MKLDLLIKLTESTQQLDESFTILMKNKTSLLYIAKRVALILDQMNLSNTPHESQTILRILSVDFSNNPPKLLLQKWSK